MLVSSHSSWGESTRKGCFPQQARRRVSYQGFAEARYRNGLKKKGEGKQREDRGRGWLVTAAVHHRLGAVGFGGGRDEPGQRSPHRCLCLSLEAI